MTTQAAGKAARRILVTGAGSGLGLALATKLAARGDQGLATSLRGNRPADLPAGIAYQSLDVCSDEDWARALDHVNDTWGGLDVLVNNAGIAAVAPVETASMAMWDHSLQVNLLGAVRGVQAFTPLLKAQRNSQIVNVASLAGLIPATGQSAYCAAKTALVAFSECLGRELASSGISTSVVWPLLLPRLQYRRLAHRRGPADGGLRPASRLHGEAECRGCGRHRDPVFSRCFGKRLCGDRKAWARRSESAPPRPSAYLV